MGKNSIAQIALGRTPEEEYKDNLRHVSKVRHAVTATRAYNVSQTTLQNFLLYLEIGRKRRPFVHKQKEGGSDQVSC